MPFSKYNPVITKDYLLTAQESLKFDRKSCHIKPSDLAKTICAFANASGGVLAVGISDTRKIIEGISSLSGTDKNNLIAAYMDYCAPAPECIFEEVEMINQKGEADSILLFHIAPSIDRIIRTKSGETYLRVADRSKLVRGDELITLEYAKNTRRFEDEFCVGAQLEHLNPELLASYRSHIGANELSDLEVLRARGFLVEKNDGYVLTNAAVLLFAKNIVQFYPNCRVRFLRYEGTDAQVGTEINIVKDINIEAPILQIIEKTKAVVSAQLREFMALNPTTGQFYSVSEYPEFAWLEGVVNAVTHREYAMSGDYIKICMFNDRLEITSPGKLPGGVTVQNIKETRYSRNPRIARVLYEFGWVRELNEGVRRIYQDMSRFFLDEPIYAEPNYSVSLTLKNNYIMREVRQTDFAEQQISQHIWINLSDTDKAIMTFLASKGRATRRELEEYTGKSPSTVSKRLKELIAQKLIIREGSRNDPTQSYYINK